MKSASNRVKWPLALGIFCGALLAAKGANACLNDPDCPNSACGGDVCDYNKNFTCQPAGVAAKGMDGWCSKDDDCKCKSLGAVCVGSTYCSFTTPAQAPGASATGGSSGHTGGASGSGGASSGSGGASSGSGGASSGSGGASSGSGGASSGSGGASSGSDAGTTPVKDSGGCAIAGSASSSGLGLLLALGAVIGLRRRRGWA